MTDAEKISKLRKALKPFADAVFNDNGDMTISYANINSENCIAAYWAMKKTEE
jgi:hypothetical protein